MNGQVKRWHSLALLFIALVGCNNYLFSQNNHYEIDDGLYAYYVKCMQNLKSKKVLAMSDTMIVMCKKKHDLKAQCLAMDVKGEYYYYNNDLKSLKKEIEKIKNFARTTPFKQYVFSIWNRLITYYMLHDQLDLALVELRKYQKEALQLNNKYGIGNSFRKLSQLYMLQNNYELSLEEMNKAISYFANNGEQAELYDAYGTLGNIYRAKNDYKKAEECLLKAVSLCKVENAFGKFYLMLADVSLQLNNMPETNKYLQLLADWKKKNHLSLAATNIESDFLISYYTKAKEYDKAIDKVKTLKSVAQRNICLSNIYDAMGDYEKAYKCLLSSYKMKEDMAFKYQQRRLIEYTARFDNERIQHERNLLELKNTKLKIDQLRTHGRMLLFEKERNGLKLSNTQLELLNKDLALQKQKSETERQKIDAHYQKNMAINALQRDAANRKTAYILISLLVLVILIMTSYIIFRIRSAKRLKAEMNEVKKARNEAEEAREEAERANQLKTIFLQNMSHEIRTPLNAIVGFSEMITDDSIRKTDAEKTQFVGLIRSNSKLLTTLIDDILDLSLLESGAYVIDIKQYSASLLCTQALAMVFSRVPKDVSLRFDKPDEDLIFNTDPARVLQVLVNFLTNACKYTEKGSIVLTFEKQSSQVVFSVTDTGCGISNEDAERVFNRFEKLNSFKQGSGLGLSICRSIAKLLHGDVKLDVSYTGGARFLFILPSSVFVA